MSKVLIAGGGAAGMFAAITAARQGQEVHVYEKNEKLGKKLFITGKGRCNITNACDMDTLFDSVITNSKFLYSSFYGYTNQDVIDFFENIGVQTKTERGERVFPQSDHSSDAVSYTHLGAGAAPKAAPKAPKAAPKAAPAPKAPAKAAGAGSVEVKAGAAGKVFKIEANVGPVSYTHLETVTITKKRSLEAER